MKPQGWTVQVWHLEKDVVREFNVPFNECYSPGMDKPIRTIAGIRAREWMAQDFEEEYDSEIHKVLSIKDWI